jgi:hypothetical protein
MNMPKKKLIPSPANLMVNIFDGTRKTVANSLQVLIRVIDGNQRRWHEKERKGPNHYFTDLPVFDNYGDNYAVIISADGFQQAGFTPVKISRGICQHVDLMLLPTNSSFNFHDATWEVLGSSNPGLRNLLSSGTKSGNAAKERYDTLRESKPDTIAAFLNITTAMKQICLPQKTPLDYFREIIWDDLQQDRFFAYADPELLIQVERAAAQGHWAPEIGCAVFHTGATKSYKQNQFGEANLQLTFHEGDNKRIDQVDCIKVEPDMDYYKDPMSHALLEVLPNTLTRQKSDPRMIYVLRWIAGRQAKVPEFDPPYTIVPAS